MLSRPVIALSQCGHRFGLQLQPKKVLKMNKLNCFRHALMAVVAVTISSSVQAATGPYVENFSQTGPTPVDNSSASWVQTNGTWAIVDGKYNHVATSTGSGFTSSSSVNFGTTFNDLTFTMSVEVTLNDLVMSGSSSALRVGFAALGETSNLTTGKLYYADYAIAVGSASVLGQVRIGEGGSGAEATVNGSTALTPTEGHTYRMTLSGVAAGAGVTLTYTVTDLNTSESASVSTTFTSLNTGNIGSFGLRSNVAAVNGASLDVSFDNFSVSASPIPEPSSYAGIMGLVMVGFIALRRRRA
jgi:hypothetical protein